MALTTLCPQCKAVCTIPDSALGQQVACSRCERVFTGDLFVPPKKLRTKQPAQKGVGALAIFLILLGASGTVAIVAASIVFFFYQYQVALHQPPEFMQAGRGGGMRFAPLAPVGQAIPEIDERNLAVQKHVAPSLVLLEAPPPFAVPKAVDRAVDLVRRPSVGEYTVSLHTWLGAEEQAADGAIANLKSRTQVELTESVQAVDASEQASIRLRYRGYLADASRNGVSRIMPLAAMPDLSWASAFFLLNERGEPIAQRMDVSRVPVGADAAVKKVHAAQRLLYEFLALPLPNARPPSPARHGIISARSRFSFRTRRCATRLLDVSATLLGAERTDAGDFAVVEIRGKLRGANEAASKEAKGWALVDSATGIVMETQVEIPFAFKLSAPMPGQVTGLLHFRCNAGSQPPLKKTTNDSGKTARTSDFMPAVRSTRYPVLSGIPRCLEIRRA